jgi:hypothetical protein
MQTTDLIARLAADVAPVSERAALVRLAIGVFVGSLVGLGVLWLTLGMRSDFATAILTVAFWVKGLFVLTVAALALWLCLRLARPESAPGTLPVTLAIPFLALGVLALFEIYSVPPSERYELWLGRSALQCPWTIAALAIPVLVGILWAFRKLAPTRQRFAGFAAGCLAGAAAAAVYATHCPESAATFVASWYTAGILLPAIFGMLAGPRLLRW